MSTGAGLVVFLVFVFTSLPLFRYTRRLRNQYKEKYPGPPLTIGSLIWGHIPGARRAAVGTRYTEWRKKFGMMYCLRGPLYEPIVVTHDPRAAFNILRAMSENFSRLPSSREGMELWFGSNQQFTAEGLEHRRMRVYLNAAFTYNSSREVSPVIFNLANQLCTHWKHIIENGDGNSATFDVREPILALTVDAISMTMLKHNMSASMGNTGRILRRITKRPFGALFTYLVGLFMKLLSYAGIELLSPIRAARVLHGEIRAIAEGVWSNVTQESGMHAKLLDLFYTKRYKIEPISKEEMFSHIGSILYGGTEPMASVISEYLYEMARLPEIQTKLRQELLDFRAEHQRDLDYEDLMCTNMLPYLDCVTKEILRVRTPHAVVTRYVTKDVLIPIDFQHHKKPSWSQTIDLKVGTRVDIPMREGVNVDKILWGDDAAEIKPERWMNIKSPPYRSYYIHAQSYILTFGDGPDLCIGRTFATAQLKIVVSTLLMNFVFEPAEGVTLDFYDVDDIIKPKVRGRERQGVQLPLRVRKL
ncbi:cytochrome P450 [Dentipellis sp. KUC8613]|nr:cytochrome P450 [Dentipellis sp. KUC8613]